MYNIPYHGEKDLSNLSFLVTGGAGFIGSNLVAYLLKFGAGRVRVLDNFSTGSLANLEEFTFYSSFELIKGDVTNLDDWKSAVQGMDVIFNEVSFNPLPGPPDIGVNDDNITRLNMLIAANVAGVKRIVDGASAFTYDRMVSFANDHAETSILSNILAKHVSSLYDDVLSGMYGTECICLQYCNVFGPKPDPADTDVIPWFIASLMTHKAPVLNKWNSAKGFTYIENVVQANIIAALTTASGCSSHIYQVPGAEMTSIAQLATTLKEILTLIDPKIADINIPLAADDRHFIDLDPSEKNFLPFQLTFTLRDGLLETVKYYVVDKEKATILS